MLPYSIGEEELVNELLEDVLLGLAPAHPGEEHAEQGDGQQGLVQHHLGDHRPGEGMREALREGMREGMREGKKEAMREAMRERMREAIREGKGGQEGAQEGGHEGGREGIHEKEELT